MSEIKERPIIFSGEMIRAILDDRKTQTRRVIKPQPGVGVVAQSVYPRPDGRYCWVLDATGVALSEPFGCPFGKPGDMLWVKETWADVNSESGPALLYRSDGFMHFCADDAYPVEYERYPNCQFTMWCTDLVYREQRGCKSDHKWRSPIHMPRWASRIQLRITDVRVERVKDISEGDAYHEGVVLPEPELQTYYGEFKRLWESINGKKHPWWHNDWVWVVEFERIAV